MAKLLSVLIYQLTIKSKTAMAITDRWETHDKWWKFIIGEDVFNRLLDKIKKKSI